MSSNLESDQISSTGGGSTPESVAVDKPPKPTKRRSEVWEHFSLFTNAEGNVRSLCKHCKKDFAADLKRNGTSQLKYHVRTCKLIPRNVDETQKELSFQAVGDNDNIGSLVNWKFDQATCRQNLAHMTIVDELPFKFVEAEGFKQFLHDVCPKFKIPSRSTVTRDCYQLYVDERLKLKNFLKHNAQRISITTDTWTSMQQVNYMCITAHFIGNDWKLYKKILNFCPITSHKGELIGRAIETCLLDWGIDNVFTITVDNASSNDVAIAYLKKKFINWGTSVAHCKYLHMRCMAHIINLIVVDGLKELDPSIRAVREAVKYIRGSPARLKKFKGFAESAQIECQNSLYLDVCTRWNSTYLMLSVAEKYEKAFDLFEFDDPYFKLELNAILGGLGNIDWDSVRQITSMLGLFYDCTKRISGSSYVTSNMFWTEISDLLDAILEWTNSVDPFVKRMRDRMKEKFDKYWGNIERMNKLIFFAVVFDPREKLMAMELAFSEIYGNLEGQVFFDNVKEALYELYAEYRKKIKPENQFSTQSLHSPSSPSSSESSMSGDSSSSGGRPRGKFRLMAKKRRMDSGSGNRSELDLYLDEALQDDREDFAILKWWKINSERFPVLAHMARDLLAVPISTVTSESAFSTGGRVLDSFRSSLTPRVVEALICAQDWLRKSNRLKVEEDLEEVEKIESALPNVGIVYGGVGTTRTAACATNSINLDIPDD